MSGRAPRLAYLAPPAYLPRRFPQTRRFSHPGAGLPKPLAERAPWIAPLALLVAAVSLGANGVLLYKLRRPEKLLAPAVDRVGARLAASGASIKYTVRIPAGQPINLDIPIDQTYTIRLRTSLPINTNVRVPVSTPFGSRSINIPVRTNIPIRQDFPVRLVDTFHLRTQTQSAYVVPLEIKLKDLPLDALRHSLDP